MMYVCADKIGIKGWEAFLFLCSVQMGCFYGSLLEGTYEINAEGTTDEPEEFTGLDATHVIVVSLVVSLPVMET
jgi:hypothetical protein